MSKFPIGIDNYGLYPLGLTPLEVLEWAKANRAEGVAFSGLFPEERKLIDRAYLDDIRQFADENRLYIEWGGAQHIPRDMESWRPKDVFHINQSAAKEAATLGTDIIRSCSGGLMRWNRQSPPTETLLRETAEALRAQRWMLADHGTILAIETHFEFTTFELLRLFDMCETDPGEYLGICLDTMNLLTMLEEPVEAVRRILPWVVSTHIKDGAVLLADQGLITFPTAVDEGVIDLPGILQMLASLPQGVHLSVEDHGGSFNLPIFESWFTGEFPDLTVDELTKILKLTRITESQRCTIVERDNWGEVCEERMKKDISALRGIASTF